MSGKIYLVCLNGNPVYVGFTIRSIEERWKEHCHEAKSNIRRKYILHKAIRKYGPNAFTISLEIEHENEEYCLNELERLTIESYGTHISDGGYNMTWGGDKPPGSAGRKHTQETKNKLSILNGGKNNSFFGKTHSNETKTKLSQSKRGIPWSEARRKAYNNRFGGN